MILGIKLLKKILFATVYLLITIGLCSCAIDLNQPVPPTAPASTAAGTTPFLSGSTPSSSGSTRPVTWANLNITGRLVYSRASSDNDTSVINVETLNLVTGEISKIFTVPDDAGIYYSSASPNGKQLVISYVPPTAQNPARNQALYVLPMDGSAPPRLLVTPPTDYDQYIQVEWSPDGKYIYFVHNNYKTQPADQIYPTYEIFRMAYPDGQPEQIVEHAFWPRLSPDSSKLVYVSLDPVAGTSELFLANADGTNPQVINIGDAQTPGIKDTPIFSPDGQSIIFSAPSPAQSYQPNWLDKLMGVQIVEAHTIPSDWWSVPITGGEPKRLTQIESTNLYGSLAPDHKHLVSYSMQGLFVMELDGSKLTALIPDPGGSTVNWLP